MFLLGCYISIDESKNSIKRCQHAYHNFMLVTGAAKGLDPVAVKEANLGIVVDGIRGKVHLSLERKVLHCPHHD